MKIQRPAVFPALCSCTAPSRLASGLSRDARGIPEKTGHLPHGGKRLGYSCGGELEKRGRGNKSRREMACGRYAPECCRARARARSSQGLQFSVISLPAVLLAMMLKYFTLSSLFTLFIRFRAVPESLRMVKTKNDTALALDNGSCNASLQYFCICSRYHDVSAASGGAAMLTESDAWSPPCA
ncbi:MAG: hypothetical protein LBE06_13035 [Azoarcus sp.]|nr:hypothetical protein [Azoarcus sp.]